LAAPVPFEWVVVWLAWTFVSLAVRHGDLLRLLWCPALRVRETSCLRSTIRGVQVDMRCHGDLVAVVGS